VNKKELEEMEEVIESPPAKVGDDIEPLVPHFPEIPKTENKGE